MKKIIRKDFLSVSNLKTLMVLLSASAMLSSCYVYSNESTSRQGDASKNVATDGIYYDPKKDVLPTNEEFNYYSGNAIDKDYVYSDGEIYAEEKNEPGIIGQHEQIKSDHKNSGLSCRQNYKSDSDFGDYTGKQTNLYINNSWGYGAPYWGYNYWNAPYWGYSPWYYGYNSWYYRPYEWSFGYNYWGGPYNYGYYPYYYGYRPYYYGRGYYYPNNYRRMYRRPSGANGGVIGRSYYRTSPNYNNRGYNPNNYRRNSNNYQYRNQRNTYYNRRNSSYQRNVTPSQRNYNSPSIRNGGSIMRSNGGGFRPSVRRR